MTTYCGYIALVGRPNVGKSTLLNRLMAQKISITSRKPQTTRHRILGIRTEGDTQYVFVDTPGIHAKEPKAINRVMNKTAGSALRDVDVAVFVVDALRFSEDDELVLSLIKRAEVPCILVVNKVDMIADKASLLPWIAQMSERHDFLQIIPLSAKSGLQVETLVTRLSALMPESPHFFGADQVTDRSTRFICSELLREKIFRLCGDELPYSTNVEIEAYQEDERLIRINALILVDKENHKRMIIGEKGLRLKEMASSARVDMEKMLGKKVFLQCWCKVKSGWADDERALKQLGYGD